MSAELDGQWQLTPEQIQQRRAAMDADVWLYIKWVCKHGAKAVERFHRPLAYLFAGDAVRLAASLNKYESELVTQIRADLIKRGIDWNTKAGIKALQRVLERVNNRISRSMGKTTIGLDVLSWLASRTPDPEDKEFRIPMSGPSIAIGIASKSDAVAQDKFCTAIGNIFKSDEYALYYSDRLFGDRDKESYITKKWIQLKGNTNPDQKTIEARGINSQWTSNHYDVIYPDDIVGTESGEASTEDAITWIAAIHGISKAAGLGGTRHLFNGTIYGPKDDNAVLVANDEFLSIRVPIWIKSVPSNVANILTDGVPVLEEWYTVEDIRRMRKETLSSLTQGPISWLQNFELTAHEDGSMSFSAELIQRSTFSWASKRTFVNGQPVEQKWIRRYLWNADGSPTQNKKKPEHECQCWKKCGKSHHDFVDFLPLTLNRSIGVDQSFSMQGDPWGIVPAAIDPYGFVYGLKSATGRGYRNMIPTIPVVFKKWSGTENPVRKVGIETNAAQNVTADWMKRDETFRYLARHIIPVSPGTQAKTVRIFNNVLANMEMGTLLIDPEDSAMQAEMLKYNAADDDPIDNLIDALSIAVTLLVTRTPDLNEAEARRAAMESEQAYLRDVDPVTGVDLTDWSSEVSAWN